MSKSDLQRMAEAAGAAVAGALMKSHGGDSAVAVESESVFAPMQARVTEVPIAASTDGDAVQITMKDGSTVSGVVNTVETEDAIGRKNSRSYATIEGRKSKKPVRVYATGDGGWAQSTAGRPGKPATERQAPWKPIHYDYLGQLKAGKTRLQQVADALQIKFAKLLNAHAGLKRADFLRVNPKTKEVNITTKGFKFLEARPAASADAAAGPRDVDELFAGASNA